MKSLAMNGQSCSPKAVQPPVRSGSRTGVDDAVYAPEAFHVFSMQSFSEGAGNRRGNGPH